MERQDKELIINIANELQSGLRRISTFFDSLDTNMKKELQKSADFFADETRMLRSTISDLSDTQLQTITNLSENLKIFTSTMSRLESSIERNTRAMEQQGKIMEQFLSIMTEGKKVESEPKKKHETNHAVLNKAADAIKPKERFDRDALITLLATSQRGEKVDGFVFYRLGINDKARETAISKLKQTGIRVSDNNGLCAILKDDNIEAYCLVKQYDTDRKNGKDTPLIQEVMKRREKMKQLARLPQNTGRV
jgi:hypothetical protein